MDHSLRALSTFLLPQAPKPTRLNAGHSVRLHPDRD